MFQHDFLLRSCYLLLTQLPEMLIHRSTTMHYCITLLSTAGELLHNNYYDYNYIYLTCGLYHRNWVGFNYHKLCIPHKLPCLEGTLNCILDLHS